MLTWTTPARRVGLCLQNPAAKHRPRAAVGLRRKSNGHKLVATGRERIGALDKRNRPIAIHGFRADLHAVSVDFEPTASLLAPVGGVQFERLVAAPDAKFEGGFASRPAAGAASVQDSF